jgi:acyl transferase domain-containing protein
MRYRANFIVPDLAMLMTELADPAARRAAATPTAAGAPNSLEPAIERIVAGQDRDEDWAALRDHDAANGTIAAGAVDWRGIYVQLGARRVRVPTYRFDQRRCWPEPAFPIAANNGAPNAGTSEIDPGDSTAPPPQPAPAGGLAKTVALDLLSHRFAGKGGA